MNAATSFRDVAIIGGGCYGSFYAAQLEKARRRGAVQLRRVLVVDRDPGCQAVREGLIGDGVELVVAEWGAFVGDFLATSPPPAGPDDAIVPSPLMPHLMADWLLARASLAWPKRSPRLAPATEPAGTPYDRVGPDGTRYLSFADWLCPTHCVEPAICPVTRGPRTWEMGDQVAEYAARLARSRTVAGAASFVTRHRAFGVGMFDAAEARAAARLVEEAARESGPVAVVVATISSCHGALDLLELGPVPPG